ncbi:MAG TPA: Holliday junction branch migration protein RuvA [Geobacteraceae bacterium]|nr:Holliday junction branch migration protein RuvA [Geobacteraceae bacterium]
MIALLSGKIALKSPDAVILDVNGVGYRVQIPFSTYFALPEEGAPLSLHIHTNVKEDAIHLFGFLTPEEKQFFQLLLGVTGVGPKLARDILSNIQPEELSAALVRGDLARLSAIPGIGKKSAERLVLELKDKIVKLGLAPDRQSSASAVQATSVRDDVASALINLGYKEAVVTKVLAELDTEAGAPMETVLKHALKRLMK